jgi:hypothetical protein
MTVTVTVPVAVFEPLTRKLSGSAGGVTVSGPTWAMAVIDPALTVKPPPTTVVPTGQVATTLTVLPLL